MTTPRRRRLAPAAERKGKAPSAVPGESALCKAVLQSYERHPYPPADSLELVWRLPPWAWMRAVAFPGVGASADPAEAPRRVLVAGCGTGREAYAIASAFPDAEVVGFDFSPRAIEIARSHATHFAGKAPRFVVADICDPALQRVLGQHDGRRVQRGKVDNQGFDFISCQGVASYVPDVEAALAGVAACLGAGGLMYLGVNGAGHHSVRLRPLFAKIGLDASSLQTAAAEEQARAVLRAYEILTSRREGELSDESASYIANDLFGPMIRCLPLGDWLRLCASAGLGYRGSLGTARFAAAALLRPENAAPLLGLPPAEVAAFLDGLISDVFHSLILTRSETAPQPAPDFTNIPDLLRWRPLVTLWARDELAGLPVHERIVTMTLTVPSLHRRATFDCPFGIVELLRRADGKSSLATLWRKHPESLRRLRPEDAAPYLFGLCHANLMTLLPPRTARV